MPPVERIPTNYPGVFYIEGTSLRGKPERIYYVRYRRNGKLIEETAGRQYRDNMTPAKAAAIRGKRSEGDQLSNAENRKKLAAEKEARNNRWTFDRLWGTYKQANPGLKGIGTDNNRYTNHIQPNLGEREPKDITPLDISRLKVKLLKTRSAATTRNVLELIRRIVNFGIKTQLCEGPGFTIKMPVVDSLKTEDLTSEQLEALLKALDNASNVQVANLMRVALYSGMRRGELFRLQWRDVDFERGFILIRSPKGGRSQKIPLNSESRKVLVNHPRTKSPYIFPGREGAQRKDIIHDANKIKEAAGLPKDFRALHGLRHVYASILASSGQIDMYTLQKLLTHKSPQMTQRYAHLRDEALRHASELAGKLISEQAKGTKDVSVMQSG